MTKPMLRELAIEEAPHEDIKDTLELINQSYDEWCAQTEQGKNNNYFFLALHDSINDMKLFLTLCIIPQPCHSHFCC